MEIFCKGCDNNTFDIDTDIETLTHQNAGTTKFENTSMTCKKCGKKYSISFKVLVD